MTRTPTDQDRTTRTEDLSRFESEGGTSEHLEHDGEVRRALRIGGLQPADADHRGRVLLVYAAREPHVYVIADALAVRLRDHGFCVELGNAMTGGMPPPEDYDVVILGLPMAFGAEAEVIGAYIEDNRHGLSEVPTALFTVSGSGTVRDHDPGGFLERFLASLAWVPGMAAAFAGGEPFPREGVLQRLAVWTGNGGPARAALRTNWTDVEAFADVIATELASAAVLAARTEPHADAPLY